MVKQSSMNGLLYIHCPVFCPQVNLAVINVRIPFKRRSKRLVFNVSTSLFQGGLYYVVTFIELIFFLILQNIFVNHIIDLSFSVRFHLLTLKCCLMSSHQVRLCSHERLKYVNKWKIHDLTLTRKTQVRDESGSDDSDWPQIGQIWDFSDQISVHFDSTSLNVLKYDLKKSRIVQFGANLTHFSPKPDIPSPWVLCQQ